MYAFSRKLHIRIALSVTMHSPQNTVHNSNEVYVTHGLTNLDPNLARHRACNAEAAFFLRAWPKTVLDSNLDRHRACNAEAAFFLSSLPRLVR